MSSEQFFLDTAYVLALLNAWDQHHSLARSLFPRVRVARMVCVTEAVLAQVGNSLAGSHRVEAADFIGRCYTTPNTRVVAVDTAQFRRALALYQGRADKEWGLTDCISFVVMKDEELVEALTTDEHFEQAGFHVLMREERTA